MRLHLVWVGKTKDRRCAALLADYLKRLARFTACEVSELKEQSKTGNTLQLIASESRQLLAAVERDDYVVLLDEAGQEFSSPELAEFIAARQRAGIKRLALVIGGFAGVSDELKQRAELKLALSRLTLPHELARVVLVEQMYRAFTLLAGLPYHKG